MEMLSSPKDRTSESVFLGLQKRQPTSELLAGTEPLLKIENQASVNIGPSRHLGPSKQATRMATINKHSAQAELSAKVRAESESVRSKLRESLAFALATGSKEQNKQKFLEKNCIGENKGVLRPANVPSLQNEIHSSAVDSSPRESLPNNLTSDAPIKKFDWNGRLPFEAGSSGNSGDKNEADSICDVQESHEKHNNVMDDVPFSGHSIMEDELLQVHGLFWASDFDTVNEDSLQNSALKRPKLMDFEENRDTKDASLQTSEKLSVLIEAELFKLFSGVNKKYKEKGRSLLFNLKDPSNPDLRERVLSCAISPEQLCTMTTEQLASNELSRWRQAKAEEYEHMVVLPDMNFDKRRLVKKTHKGEFQVEVEQDDGAHVDVGLGSDVFSKILAKPNDVDQSQYRSNDKEPTLSKTPDSLQGEKSDSDGRNVSINLDHRLSEKTDYIQDFMVEDLKDTELLPPVVSLDEFMQALDSEPPFQNLEADNLQENPSFVNRNIDRSESESIPTPDTSVSKIDSKIDSVHIHTEHAKETSSSNKGQVDHNYQKIDDKQKTDGAYAKYVTGITDSEIKSNFTWEGFLQLNVSALSNVMAFFLSGERTSMKEWPSLLEVKGRVRLDAFEKFMQELPLSRSRTIMVVEFSWKEDSLEGGRPHFSEAIHSYITDERVGFAEPVPGVELYLCPSHPKITTILAHNLATELLDSINSVVNGLIGIVVWRRPHVTISPRVSSHHHRRHGSSKKHSSSKKTHESVNHSFPQNPMQLPNDEDDVPPGFGPPIGREDDDLPEFDFSRGRSSHRAGALAAKATAPPGSSIHVRELIQKYGHGESTISELGIPVEPWNDEDDIPEWNPNQNTRSMPPPLLIPPPLPTPPPPPPPHVYQQQRINTHPFAINQNMMPPQFIPTPPPPIQPQVGGMQPSNTPWQLVAQGMPVVRPRPCHMGGRLGSGRPPGSGIGPNMIQGFGGVRNGLGLWRPDNNNGSKGA